MSDISSFTSVDLINYATLNLGLFFCIVLVIMMQPGFLLLEVGSVSRRNALNDAFKNSLDLCVGGLAYWLVGHTIYTGDAGLLELFTAIGLAQPLSQPQALIQAEDTLQFLYQMAFAATGATICSAAVTGRIWSITYLMFVAVFSGFIYPLVAFLAWNPASILAGSYTDFAGGVVVHACGAAAGLAGTLLLRPRLGYNGYDPMRLGRERLFRIAARHAPHNVPMAALGVFLLWLGWYGFNGGTAFLNGVPLSAEGGGEPLQDLMRTLGNIAIATTLAPCAAAAATLLIRLLMREDLDLLETLNSLVAGLVAVTAGAHLFSAPQAILVGVAAAVIYRLARRLFVRLTIDDPVSAIAAHGLTGVAGAVAVAFVLPGSVAANAAQQLGASVGLVAMVFLLSLLAFKLVEAIALLCVTLAAPEKVRKIWRHGALRIHHDVEMSGIDETLHGQDAYSFLAKD